MSYASALLNGVSEDRPISPPKPQPQKTQPAPQKTSKPASQSQEEEKREQEPPQPKVVLKLEGNDGGDLGKLFKDEKNVALAKGEEGKKQRKKKDNVIFDQVLVNLGPGASSALGRTCKSFHSQVFNNKAIGDNIFNGRQKMYKPTISFRVDFVEVKAKEGEKQEAKEVKNFPLTYFADNRRQIALGKYWERVVSQAQNASDSQASDPSAIVSGKKSAARLHGGLVFAGNKRGPLVAQRDLTRTLSWLDATSRLLQGKMQQEVPYLDGRVLLTRYGLGGTKIKVEVVVPSQKKGEDSPPTVHRYDFAEFCMALRSAAKGLVPIVGTCVESLRKGSRNVPEEETDSYVQREKILINLLKHDQLNNGMPPAFTLADPIALTTIKRLLIQGAIPGSDLPTLFRNKRLEKLRLRQQQQLELKNINAFLEQNIPDDFELARQQAEKLTKEAKEQKEKAWAERQKSWEERKQTKGKQGEKDEEEPKKKEEKPTKELKRVVKKEVDSDGFTVVTKTFVNKKGEVVEDPVFPKSEQAEVAASPKQQAKSTGPSIGDNPYNAVLLSGNYASLEDEQHKKNMAKAKEREVAEQLRRAKLNKEKKLKAQEASPAQKKGAKGQQKGQQKGGQKGQGQKQGQAQKQGQQNQPQKKQPQQEPEQKPQQQKPKAKPAQPKKAQKGPKQSPKGKKAKQPQVPETSDYFQPTAIALSVVGAIAFGYLLLSGAM